MKKITTFYKAVTKSMPLYILILFIAFQNLYSQEADTTVTQTDTLVQVDSTLVKFAKPADFNESPHFNIPITTSYTQFPDMPCSYILFDMSDQDNLFVKFEDKELKLHRDTKVIFRVTNMNEIWCKTTNDKWISVRYLE
jgi:hypothetical protein